MTQSIKPCLASRKTERERHIRPIVPLSQTRKARRDCFSSFDMIARDGCTFEDDDGVDHQLGLAAKPTYRVQEGLLPPVLLNLMQKTRLLQHWNGKLFGEPKLPIVVILFWPGNSGHNLDPFSVRT